VCAGSALLLSISVNPSIHHGVAHLHGCPSLRARPSPILRVEMPVPSKDRTRIGLQMQMQAFALFPNTQPISPEALQHVVRRPAAFRLPAWFQAQWPRAIAIDSGDGRDVPAVEIGRAVLRRDGDVMRNVELVFI
jgi:hypothetical protein